MLRLFRTKPHTPNSAIPGANMAYFRLSRVKEELQIHGGPREPQSADALVLSQSTTPSNEIVLFAMESPRPTNSLREIDSPRR